MSVTVSCGVNELTSDDFAGWSVATLRRMLQSALFIADGAPCYVNGRLVQDRQFIVDGDNLEFRKVNSVMGGREKR